MPLYPRRWARTTAQGPERPAALLPSPRRWVVYGRPPGAPAYVRRRGRLWFWRRVQLDFYRLSLP